MWIPGFHVREDCETIALEARSVATVSTWLFFFVQKIWKYDYAGIVVLIVTSFVPVVYYSFLCSPRMQTFYLLTTCFLGKLFTVSVIFQCHKRKFLSTSATSIVASTSPFWDFAKEFYWSIAQRMSSVRYVRQTCQTSIIDFFSNVYVLEETISRNSLQLDSYCVASGAGLITIAVSLMKTFQHYKYRTFRACLFAGLGLWGVVPGAHALLKYGSAPWMQKAFTLDLLMGLTYLVSSGKPSTLSKTPAVQLMRIF